MIRWLDFNDALAAAQGGHPSDNLGAILAVADYLARNRDFPRPPLLMRDVLTALAKCYEIHGVLSLENRLEPLGFDYVVLPKVAAAAVLTKVLGGTRDQIISAVSNAWPMARALRFTATETTRARARVGLPAMLRVARYGSHCSR